MSSAPSTPAKPKRRRRLQFSLRTMLLGVLVFALVCAWLGGKIKAAREQQEAAKAITAAGGFVMYKHQLREAFVIPGPGYRPPQPPGTKWLHSLLGEDFFARVASVHYPPGAGDDMLGYLDHLPYLTQIDLGGTGVSGAALAQVKKHENIESLSLRSTDVTDADLVHLGALRRLESLDLAHTAVTHKALATLAELPRLQRVRLEGTHVSYGEAQRLLGVKASVGNSRWTWARAPSEKDRRTAAALERRGARVSAQRKIDGTDSAYCLMSYQDGLDDAQIEIMEGFEAMTKLMLAFMPIEDEHWARIMGCRRPGSLDTEARAGRSELPTRLRSLVIRDVPLDDDQIALITNLVNLEDLDLRGTQITDRGLAHIAALPQLKALGLEGAQLSDGGLQRLSTLTNLKSLELHGSQLTDAALEQVGALGRLEELELWCDQLTDAGLAHLTRMTNLRRLLIHSPNITDAGLLHLAKLPNLRSLELHKAKISSAGVKRLKTFPQLESCRIDFRDVILPPDHGSMREGAPAEQDADDATFQNAAPASPR
ncbi:MAG TPA: hypothetical protein VMY37_24155 [Thermoguttaceae bacterium]|nr:hypothetical protein [Thermoguttaceae bacterium]